MMLPATAAVQNSKYSNGSDAKTTILNGITSNSKTSPLQNSHKLSPITAHVMDASIGKPAAGVEIRLQEHHQLEGGLFTFNEVAYGITNAQGVCTDILPSEEDINGNSSSSLKPGLYKIIFRTKEYYEKIGKSTFYPWIEITFEINGSQNCHIPLQITPFSFSTSRDITTTTT